MRSDQIVGAWELVSFVAVDRESGEQSYPLGSQAVGLIIYTSDGYMSAQIMTPGRPNYDVADFAGGTQPQTVAAASGYMAYSGPYQVDERTGVVRHYLEVSLLPNWLKSIQVRNGLIDGDRLTLSADEVSRGRTLQATLVWARPARPSAEVFGTAS